MDKDKESKTVFVIIREYPSVKAELVRRQFENGFDSLTDYVRNFWKELL